MADLEVRLGVKLLNCTTRYARVTNAGQRYLEDARCVIDLMAERLRANKSLN